MDLVRGTPIAGTRRCRQRRRGSLAGLSCPCQRLLARPRNNRCTTARLCRAEALEAWLHLTYTSDVRPVVPALRICQGSLATSDRTCVGRGRLVVVEAARIHLGF